MSSNPKGIIMKNVYTIIAVLAVCLFAAGCDKAPEPKVSKYVIAEKSPAQVAKETKDEADRLAEEKRKQDEVRNQQEQNKKMYAENVAGALTWLKTAKNIDITTQAEISGLISAEGEDVLLASVVNRAIEKIVQRGTSSNNPRDSYEYQEQLVSGVLVWAQKNMGMAEKIADAVTPSLKTKPGLVLALKSNNKLLSKTYTSKSFNELKLCMSGKGDLSDKTQCRRTLNSFGVKFTEKEEGAADEVDRNAMWLVWFLIRRDINGGENFAIFFQQAFWNIANNAR